MVLEAGGSVGQGVAGGMPADCVPCSAALGQSAYQKLLTPSSFIAFSFSSVQDDFIFIIFFHPKCCS